jgi:hypothetical protein
MAVSWIKQKLGFRETDSEIVKRHLEDFLSKKNLLDIDSFNKLMETSELDNGLTPVDNFLDIFLNPGGCYRDQNLLNRQMDEFNVAYENSNALLQRRTKISEEANELEKEIVLYKKILEKEKYLNGGSLIPRFLFGKRGS